MKKNKKKKTKNVIIEKGRVREALPFMGDAFSENLKEIEINEEE